MQYNTYKTYEINIGIIFTDSLQVNTQLHKLEVLLKGFAPIYEKFLMIDHASDIKT